MKQSSNVSKVNTDLKGSFPSQVAAGSRIFRERSSSPLNPSTRLFEQRKHDNSDQESDYTDDETTKSYLVNDNLPNIGTKTGSPVYKLRKTKPYGQLQDVNKSNTKLHRIYSENETSNFSQVNGRRMFDDQRHRPHRTKFFDLSEYIPEGPAFSARSFSNFYQPAISHVPKHKGLEDEYIPDFDFSNTIQQWTDSYYRTGDYDHSFGDSSINDDSIPSSGISRASTPVGNLHSVVSPVSVPKPRGETKHIQTTDDSLTHDEELIISKLPQNFTDLPFSVRRKLLADISPNGNTESINRIVKKKFKKRQKSSPAVQFLSSFSERSSRPDEKDSLVLDHKLGGIIGYGAWGLIRECTSDHGTSRAMKIVRVKSDAAREFFKRETTIWGQLHHENLLPLINIKETPNTIFCLTERAYGGTLFDIVSKWGVYPSKTITAEERLSFIKKYSFEILKGLNYMHSHGYVHGDVKLENCLISDKSPSGKVILCDFGMSLRFKTPADSEEVTLPKNNVKIKRRPSIPRSLSGNQLNSPKALRKIFSERLSPKEESKSPLARSNNSEFAIDSPTFAPKPFEYEKNMADSNLPHSHIGSLPYAAPELLESSPPPLGPSADIWAFGVLLYTMIVGRLPFQHQFEPRLRAMISAGKYDIEALEQAVQHHDNFYEAVVGCLCIDMNKRLSLDQVQSLIEAADVQDPAQ